jgi:formylglycine-generating enzyme required for sulfatase activity
MVRRWSTMAMGAALLSSVGIGACGQNDGAPTGEQLAVLKTFVDELVPITPGKGAYPKSFLMGSEGGAESERPVHEVTFEYEFAIAKYEVPQNLYQAVMGANPSRWKGRRNSAEMMNWQEANEFCRRLTGLLRGGKLIAANEEIRLPTEAEWEYCCRSGTTTAYSFGDQAQVEGDAGNKASLLNPYAWHTGNAAGNDPAVGVLKPNPWGLYDVHGYLWEFCADEWHDSHDGAPSNGSARPSDGDPKRIVIRGGSWKDPYPELRSSARRVYHVSQRDDAVGIRCVKARTQPSGETRNPNLEIRNRTANPNTQTQGTSRR